MPQLGAVEDVDGPQPRTGNHGKQKYGFEYNTAEMVVANNVAFNNPWQSTAPKIIGKEKGAVAKLNFLPDSFCRKIIKASGLEPAVLSPHLDPVSFANLFHWRPLGAPGGCSVPLMDTCCPAPLVEDPVLVDQVTRCPAPQVDGTILVEQVACCPAPLVDGPILVDQVARQIVDALVLLRNGAAMGNIWEQLPNEARSFLLAEVKRRGCRPGPYMR